MKWPDNGMFILSHFCIHKYTGAIAAVHLMRNIYLYVCIIRRWKICLEINHVLCVPNYTYIYLIKVLKICLEVEHVRLPIYMYVYLIRRWKICLEVSGFFSTCRRWDQETTTGLLKNYIGYDQTHVQVCQ